MGGVARVESLLSGRGQPTKEESEAIARVGENPLVCEVNQVILSQISTLESKC